MTVAAVAVLGTMAVVAAPAGAGVSVGPGSCSFTLSATTLTAPGPVSVSGTAPASTIVTVNVDGKPVATTTSDSVTGKWGPVTVDIAASSTVSITLPAVYATIPCVGVGAVEVSPATISLPRTGSNTVQYVFAAAALIAVGAVLLIAARRRHEVNNRV